MKEEALSGSSGGRGSEREWGSGGGGGGQGERGRGAGPLSQLFLYGLNELTSGQFAFKSSFQDFSISLMNQQHFRRRLAQTQKNSLIYLEVAHSKLYIR